MSSKVPYNKRVPIKDLKLSPYNVREKIVRVVDLWREFMDSIKSTDGPLQNPVVNSKMEVVIGKRRIEACKQLNIEDINVTVNPLLDDPVEAIVQSYHENEKRAGLEADERSKAYRLLMKCGLTQKQVAFRLGISKELVSKILSYDDMHEDYDLPEEFNELNMRKKQSVKSILLHKGKVPAATIKKIVDKAFKLTSEEMENLAASVRAGGDLLIDTPTATIGMTIQPTKATKLDTFEGTTSKSKEKSREQSIVIEDDSVSKTITKEDEPVESKTTKVTLHIPNTTFKKYVDRSKVLRISVDDLLVNSLVSNVPS